MGNHCWVQRKKLNFFAGTVLIKQAVFGALVVVTQERELANINQQQQQQQHVVGIPKQKEQESKPIVGFAAAAAENTRIIIVGGW